jgi:diacylglycerol kinase family enzyme
MNKSEKNRVIIIINPISGVSHRGFDEFKSLVESTLDLDIYAPDIFVTSYAGHAGEIALQGLESGVKYFVVVGGDGTVNDVGAILSGTDAILGIIPAGSGNGLANHLEIPIKTTLGTIPVELPMLPLPMG